VETLEYIAGLRRRIEVQNDQMEHLAAQVHALNEEVDKLSLDLDIKQGGVPPGTWVEVPK
jgi:cell division protein FtsB